MATSAKDCSSSVALLLVVMACAAATGASAAIHVVGDDQQWTIPDSPTTYTDWARKQTFLVGDTLVFNFPEGAHDVFQVNSSSYDACDVQDPIASYITSPATVNLTSSGAHYFVCGVGAHCAMGGQKMALTVVSGAAAPSSLPDSPPPSASTSNGAHRKAANAAVALATASVAALVL